MDYQKKKPSAFNLLYDSVRVICFTSAREAKEFLVGRIVDEAQRDGTPLSEVERKMLYFTETYWAPPDIADTAQQFECECDASDYERKITQLIRTALNRADQTGIRCLD